MPGLVTAARPAGAVTSAVLVSTPEVAETSDSHAWMRMHTPSAVQVRMIIMGGASVRGTATVNKLFFLRGVLLFCSRAVVLGVEGVMMAVRLLEETSADSQPAAESYSFSFSSGR